jgi:hypothetical protein
VAIADVYDALYTKRVYKEAYPHKVCVEMIRMESGKQFDPVLVKIFLKLEAEFHDIARSCRDAVEEPHPLPAFADDAIDLAAASEASLDGKFSEIEAMLDECAGDRRGVKESPGKMRGSAPSNCEPPQNTACFDHETIFTTIESEQVNVS